MYVLAEYMYIIHFRSIFYSTQGTQFRITICPINIRTVNEMNVKKE